MTKTQTTRTIEAADVRVRDIATIYDDLGNAITGPVIKIGRATDPMCDLSITIDRSRGLGRWRNPVTVDGYRDDEIEVVR